MPEMVSYVVTQTREVKITANSAADAVVVATATFDHKLKPDEIWGHATTDVRITDISAREAY
jgi:hypothetical protein